MDIINRRKRYWLGHRIRQTRGNVLLETLEELVNGKRNRGRRIDQLVRGTRMRYQDMRRLAQDREAWRKRAFVRPGFGQKTHDDYSH